MNILVAGGAGYIGSHMVQLLRERDNDCTVFDDLSTGHADAVGSGELVVGDVRDEKALIACLEDRGPFDVVMHFCAKSLVGESVSHPSRYYDNNVVGTLSLINAMRRTGHDRLVFSSSAATYGMPSSELIDETHPCSPINPYGMSKLMVEQMLAHFHSAYGFRSVSLRYFNAAGAHPTVGIGERHDPETHLIPNVLCSLHNEHKQLKVFGDDYDTRDGTCVRDYVHVDDLCDAHLRSIDYMASNNGAHVFNLGNGNGFSVLEVIRAACSVVGAEIPFEVVARRSGDPDVLVADATRAKELLGWQPSYTDIESIIGTAWRFPNGEVRV